MRDPFDALSTEPRRLLTPAHRPRWTSPALVGTGYCHEALARRRGRLDRLEGGRSPSVGDVGEQGVHWVRPTLMGEFGFAEWTRDGTPRHPRFLGLRTDKRATDVRRERAAG